jgi:RND superfamily putative drug exporter
VLIPLVLVVILIIIALLLRAIVAPLVLVITTEEARYSGTRQGILRGLGVTGGVITAAGVVLGGTFAALAQLPSAPIAEVGTAVALGVLLDTLLVRTVLVPASLLTIGERAWWPAVVRGR